MTDDIPATFHAMTTEQRLMFLNSTPDRQDEYVRKWLSDPAVKMMLHSKDRKHDK